MGTSADPGRRAFDVRRAGNTSIPPELNARRTNKKGNLANFQADTVLRCGPLGIIDAAAQSLQWLGDLG
jgi:hypothetical protein